jgi:hypothetical protein
MPTSKYINLCSLNINLDQIELKVTHFTFFEQLVQCFHLQLLGNMLLRIINACIFAINGCTRLEQVVFGVNGMKGFCLILSVAQQCNYIVESCFLQLLFMIRIGLDQKVIGFRKQLLLHVLGPRTNMSANVQNIFRVHVTFGFVNMEALHLILVGVIDVHSIVVLELCYRMAGRK